MSGLAFTVEPTPRFDISDASRFGKITEIWPNTLDQPPLWSNSWVRRTIERMMKAGYDEHRDFIIVSGPVAPTVLLVAHLVAEFECVNLLFFDAKAREYIHKAILKDTRHVTA
jgi:hypothetical protein